MSRIESARAASPRAPGSFETPRACPSRARGTVVGVNGGKARPGEARRDVVAVHPRRDEEHHTAQDDPAEHRREGAERDAAG
jgi:hypothetical protein